MDEVLHRRRPLLHRRQMTRHRMGGRVMCSLRRMVRLICMSLFLSSTHLLHAPLVLCAALVLHAALVVEPTGLRRVAAIGLPRWGGRPPMADVIHASPSFVRGWLLLSRFVFPLAHPLGANRKRPIVLPVERFSGHSGLWRRSSRLNTTLDVGFRVCIGGLVLRVSRFWRRHPVVVNRSRIIPRTIGAVRHHGRTRWRRWAVYLTMLRNSAWWGADISGIRHAGSLMRCLCGRRRRRRRRSVMGWRRRWSPSDRAWRWARAARVLVWPQLLLLSGTGLPWERRRATVWLPLVVRVWWLRRRINL